MAPLLMINPRSDAEFSSLVQGLVDAGTTTPDQLALELRLSYPLAVARGRLLSGEFPPTWYVYREGHWIPDLHDAVADAQAYPPGSLNF